MLFEETNIEITELKDPLFVTKQLSVFVARLDKIHPVISGNKLFKLHYFFEKSCKQNNKPIITFGGAWSNHLLATAYACKLSDIKCIGIVRGEKPATLSQTLLRCQSYGMQLHFISRTLYDTKETGSFIAGLTTQFGDCIIIPEGGYHALGSDGASLIMNKISNEKATHVCTAVGTATTLAGLLKNRINNEKIIGIPVLKNMTDIETRVISLGSGEQLHSLDLYHDYHFGGYAKKTNELLDFMNLFYTQHMIPTDFIYTAKLMFAITDKIKTGYFPAKSKIICLHTGGLQGNSSLPPGTLVF